MKIAPTLALAAAVSAALLAAGVADASSGKKKGKSAQPSTAVTAPAGSNSQGNSDSPPGVRAAGGAFLLNHFDEIDADKSGQLSREEIQAWVDAKKDEVEDSIEAKIKAADTNADGLISLAEAQAALPLVYANFQFIDANGDGQISKDEFERLKNPAALKAAVLAKLKAADTNADGKIDLAEAQVALPGIAATFTKLDKNGDGFITLDEIAAVLHQS